MKLETVSIKNYRSIKHIEFRFPKSGFLVLVGANNAGKSNIIHAIDALCGDQFFNREKLEDHDYYLRQKSSTIRIELGFSDRRRALFASDEDWAQLLGSDDRPVYRTKARDVFPCVYLGADRTFDRQMSFYDWTLIGKIRRAFHLRAASVEEELKEKFQELVQVFDKVPGFLGFKNDFGQFFDEMQADTAAKLAITFDPYTPANYFKTMQVVGQDPHIGEKLALEELGEGSRNMVLLALLRSYAKNFRQAGEDMGGILALEEPELYMHPQARRHLFKVLREIAQSGMQVIISTHSASFIDTEFFDSVGRVVKEPDDETPDRFETKLKLASKRLLVDHCKRTGVPESKVTVENIGEFYKTTANPLLNEGFFARLLVLVEGDTEELALPVFLAKEGFDCDLLGISVISVRGKSQIPKYWRMFSAFEIPTLVVADNDDDNGKKAKSNQGLAVCLGLPLENLLGVTVSKLLRSANEQRSPIIMLEETFEVALRKSFAAVTGRDGTEIDAWEQEARDLIRPVRDQNKGQIARYVARKLCDQYPEFTPMFVAQIVEVLKDAGFNPHPPEPDYVLGPPEDDPIYQDDDEIPF